MKKLTTGIFPSRAKAEEAIIALHRDLHISNDDISYIYRNTNDKVQEVTINEVSTTTPAEGAASGAVAGGTIGAIAGIATVVGLIPVIGPIFAAGTFLTALGIGLGAGAVGTTVAAAATGAAAGGLLGGLVNLGVPDTQAKEYEDRVVAGDILVAVHAENAEDIERTFNGHGALDVDTYTPAI